MLNALVSQHGIISVFNVNVIDFSSYKTIALSGLRDEHVRSLLISGTFIFSAKTRISIME